MSNGEVCVIKVNGTSAPETKINLTTIKRSDQYINRIISTTSHVEVYKFDDSTKTWERTTTEGSLFIYNRAKTPAFAFVVLNRLNSGNILEYIVPGKEFKTEGAFVMYKSTDDVYYGLHFDDTNECNRVGDVLIRISTGTENDAEGQDVVQMLEKAFHQSAEGSGIAERKQKAVELRKDSPRRSSDPNEPPRKSTGKQQRLSKSTKKESRTQSPSKKSTTAQQMPAKANNSERVSTKHLSRAETEELHDLKRQLFRSPERTKSKEIPLSSTSNKLSVGSTVLSSSLPHTMLSLAEVEKKLHSSVTTANSSSSSSIIINRPRSVETVSESQLIDPSSFAVPATKTSLPNSKSAARLTKAASLDIQSLPHSFSQPMLVDKETLQVPSHFPPVPPVMVSPGMRSAPVSSSSDQGLIMKPTSTTVQTGSAYPKQQQPATTTAEKPLPPSSYQTPSRQTNVETVGKELSVSKAQAGPQNGLLSPMVFQDNPAVVHSSHKPTPVLGREQFVQAMLYMIQNDKDFSDRLYWAYQQSLSDSLH